jgi:hypothetical protein
VSAARTDAHAHAQLALRTNSTDQPIVKPAVAPAHHGAPASGLPRGSLNDRLAHRHPRPHPVPERPSAAPAEAWLTLTSCEPKHGSTNRYIVFAKLDRAVPRADGPPQT